MKKYFIPFLIIFLGLSVQSCSASGDAQGLCSCFDAGYNTGVQYYKTGDKNLINYSKHPCCKNPQLPKCNAYQGGVGYVIQYGPQKTYEYDEMRHSLRMLELLHN